MASELNTAIGVEALVVHGDARENSRWRNGDPDYIKQYSLTSADIPALIEVATEPSDEYDGDDIRCWGPVHAWRALAQLRAPQCVEPLLDTLNDLDLADDDWYLEEFPDVWGMVGEAALAPLAKFMADGTNQEFPRVATASGIVQVGVRHPHTRESCIELLSNELARHQTDGLEEYNGWLVSDLLKLEAIEAAETIERAYAADVIDPTISGHWGDVRRKLGVSGLGLAPDKSQGWPTIREKMGLARTSFRKPVDPDELARREAKKRHDAAAKARVKKKKQRQNRKKNRKAR